MEFTAANQPPYGRAADGPSAIPPEFGELVTDLAQRAKSSSDRLGAQLEATRSAHDLSRGELLAAQRDMARLHRIGADPSPTEYWQRSALPRAAAIVDASMNAVVEEGELLGKALDRFMTDLDGSPLQEWAAGSAGQATVVHVTTRAIDQLLLALPSSEGLDGLGAWWQRRLRRAAVYRSLPRLLVAGPGADALIGRHEMALLDRPPWSHGDRLLSAFELAHNEIRTQTELVMEGLTSRVGRRGRTYAEPSERVTIELRE